VKEPRRMTCTDYNSPKDALIRLRRCRHDLAGHRCHERRHWKIHEMLQAVQEEELELQILQLYADRRDRSGAAARKTKSALRISDLDVGCGDLRKDVAHSGRVIGRRVAAGAVAVAAEHDQVHGG